jgi:predicted nucleic acid-binding protein
VPTYLLDTNIIIDALNDKRGRRESLLGLLNQSHLLACCPINVAEVYSGIRPKEEIATADFLQSLDYYPLTWPVARLAGLLKTDHARRGATLTLADCAIAAVAIVHDLTLITDNIKDFPMPELWLHPLPIR